MYIYVYMYICIHTYSIYALTRKLIELLHVGRLARRPTELMKLAKGNSDGASIAVSVSVRGREFHTQAGRLARRPNCHFCW